MKQSYAIYTGDHVMWVGKDCKAHIYSYMFCYRNLSPRKMLQKIYYQEDLLRGGQEPASKYWFPGPPEDVPLQRPQDVP